MRHKGGFYWGIAAGASIPTGNFTNAGVENGGYSTGWNITIPVGYDWNYSPLGVRLDVAFDQLAGQDFNTNFTAPNLNSWSANLDLKLRVPLGKSFNRFYVLGGATYSNLSGWFTDFSDPNNPSTKESFGDSNGRWGWNAGGGFSFNWGHTVGMFLESRYVWVDANVVAGFPYNRAEWVPIVLGVTF
jgi:hypothetical protein